MPTPEKPDLREMMRDQIDAVLLHYWAGTPDPQHVALIADAAMNALAEHLARPDVVQAAAEAIRDAISVEPESWHETADFDEAARAVLARLSGPPAAG